MEVLHQLASYSDRQPSSDRKEIPEVVCYEKQSCPGGMWNLNWRVGKPRYNLSSDQTSFMFFVKSPKSIRQVISHTPVIHDYTKLTH